MNPEANSFAACPDTYYCEYYYSGGRWNLIGANTASGYYCPVKPPLLPGETGDMECLPQFNANSQTTPDEGENFVEYEFRDGAFQVSKANCPAGYHAPADPIEFAKQTGKLRIYPVRLDGSGDDVA